MLIDSTNLFDPAGTAITVTANSTNILDMGITGGLPSVQGRDIAIGAYKLSVRAVVQAAFLAAGAATLQLQILAAPDNGSGAPGTFSIYAQTDAIPKANLTLGQFIELPVPPAPPQAGGNPEDGEPSPPRFYKLNYVVATGPFTAGTVQAWLGDPADLTIPYKSGFSISA